MWRVRTLKGIRDPKTGYLSSNILFIQEHPSIEEQPGHSQLPTPHCRLLVCTGRREGGREGGREGWDAASSANQLTHMNNWIQNKKPFLARRCTFDHCFPLQRSSLLTSSYPSVSKETAWLPCSFVHVSATLASLLSKHALARTLQAEWKEPLQK